MKDINVNAVIAWIVNLLLGIIGFFLVASYNRTNEVLGQINKDVLNLNKEIVALRIDLTEINAKLLTEDRVKELIQLELLKLK